MIRHEWLVDPIVRTRDMEESEFTKYVRICEEHKNRNTSSVVFNMVRKQFHHYAETKITDKQLRWIWKKVAPKIRANAGLAQFTLDYGGAESDYFFPWLIEIDVSPSGALEMAYGAGRDLNWMWVDNVPKKDNIYGFVRNDPTFVYNRERQLYVADLVTSVQDKSIPLSESRVVDLGAGRLAWARWHGFNFCPMRQQIIAVDRDETIMPDALFHDTPARTLRVHYLHYDISKAFGDPLCQDADLVILGGVASYYPMETFMKGVIAPTYKLLKNGGVFFFDLQIDCPYLRRSMEVFGWPELRLVRSAEDAISLLEKVRKRLWSEGMKFSAEYRLDTYNEKPTAVMVTLTKI